jgi:23S rRNA (guanosine2251-2'-O)-methyltransferase
MEKLKITEMNRLSTEEFHVHPKTPLIVVLDNVRSMHNVGSVFRTADAFLIEAVYLCGITCCPPNAEIHKTALGAENTVSWKYFENTTDAVLSLKNESYTVLAIEQAKGSTLLPDLQLNHHQKYAVILGNEVKGVQQSVIDSCDGCIEIPQFGTKHSLNVSVTSGIIIWEIFQKLKG